MDLLIIIALFFYANHLLSKIRRLEAKLGLYEEDDD